METPSTHVEFHVGRVLVQPLLVHYRKGHAVKQIKGPFVFWIFQNLAKNQLTRESWSNHNHILPESICKKTDRTKVLGFAAHTARIKTRFAFTNWGKTFMESEWVSGHSQASKSSICMIMKVMLTPATANGYSQAALLPPCFFNRCWNEVYANGTEKLH